MRIITIITIILIQFVMLAGCETNNKENTENSTVVDNNIVKDEQPVVNNSSLSMIITNNRKEAINKTHAIVTNKNDQMADAVFEILNIKDEDMKKYAISISPLNIEAYCIAIIKPFADKEYLIINSLQEYKQNQISFFNNYLSEQCKIALNAELVKVDDYILFVMAKDSKTLIRNIGNALSKLKYELEF